MNDDSLILGIQCLQKTLNESFGERERPQRETSTPCFITMVTKHHAHADILQ